MKTKQIKPLISIEQAYEQRKNSVEDESKFLRDLLQDLQPFTTIKEKEFFHRIEKHIREVDENENCTE